jgi:lipase chaperone LimK
MRKFILITALVLVSASAQAGITRGLTLASNDPSATAEQSKAAEAPKSAARQQPSIPQQSGQNPQQNSQSLQQSQRSHQSQRMQRPGLIAAAKYAVAVKVAALKRQGESTLARVKYAMHRHGIYW